MAYISDLNTLFSLDTHGQWESESFCDFFTCSSCLTENAIQVRYGNRKRSDR